MKSVEDLAGSVGAASKPAEGNGSVAHQIIGKFLEALASDQAFAEITPRLAVVLYGDKPTEEDIRTALFGEVEL
jgi:hypothetical protein